MAEILITIPEGLSDRLDKALARAAPEPAALSRSRLARLIAEGAVTGPSGPVRDGKARAEPGDYSIEIGAPEPLEALPETIPLNIAHEDADLIVVDKPAGMVVHPAPGTPTGTLVNALLAHCADSLSGIGGAARPGIVHRIDKDTSGLLVVAKTDRAHQGLARQFAYHSAHRRYLAIAHGTIDAGDARLRGLPGIAFEPGNLLRITSMLGRHPTDRQRQAVSFERGRHAVTRARMLESFGAPPAAMLVECRLETGRTHQIRVHMAHAGLGLVGDPVYGGGRRPSARALGVAGAAAIAGFPRQALHAAELGFDHPVSGLRLAFSSPLPQDMTGLLEALRNGSAATELETR
ncbi:ribosomal large subunit pseudouridine synthase D [Paracoccus halophilus]|uniref:Pseudouridine synthase n=1 Tax=Paracoccus halophilus TaxID=376733 RepID=A0A099F2W1_9RHOB|nr:pseudouridine synthase [Paracoccus halophilus]KGJ04603.1 pseudouridine synthase [Paracoccus halophilus]SFA50042.1 ribosomal large subunit pseudouridine synthase D [Paracoccus halophilus]